MAWLDIVKGVGSAIGGVGSFFSGASGLVQPFLSFSQNKALQQDAQQWQERMSNTAHQREMQDLQKAGLNPILTATGGQGASTGSVGANTAQGFGSSDGFTQLQSYMNNSAQIDNLKAQTANMKQDSILKGAQVMTERQRLNNQIQELYESRSREGLNRSQIRRIDSEISLMKKQMQGIDSTIALNAVNQNQALANTNLLNEHAEAVRRSNRFMNDHPVLYGLGTGANSLLPVGAVAGGAYMAGSAVKNKYFKPKVGFR